MRALATLRAPHADQVYRALVSKPASEPGRLAVELGMSRSSITKIADRLEKVCLVERIRSGRTTRLMPVGLDELGGSPVRDQP